MKYDRPGLFCATGLIWLLGGCSLFGSGAAPQELPAGPLIPEPERTQGSLFATGGGSLLFEDLKATGVGDLLTVLLVERTDASKSSSTSTSKQTSVENAAPTVLGRAVSIGGTPVLQNEVSGEQSFAGQGASTQSNRLAGSVSVTVVERLANGNLVVQGEKLIHLNEGQEHVRIAGIVRPQDIAPDNTVTSDRIADAKIAYSGKGALRDANRMGFLARFFNSPWSPF